MTTETGDGWQPIETAPNRTEVLTWDGECIRVAARGTSDDTDADLADNPKWAKWYEWDLCGHVPTHWMPLPEPPR